MECCNSLCASVVCCRFNSAVVRVTAQFILTTIAPQSSAPAFDWSSTASANQTAVYETHSNGSLIKGKLIVCPASTVTAPPDVFYQGGTAIYRYPYVGVPGTAAGDGTPNAITRASRILVDIFDVNGKGHAYTYEAYLVGVDGAGNTAVLAIDIENPWNSWLPCIEPCHPYFRWSRSRKSKCGDPVFLLGSYSDTSYPGSPMVLSSNQIQQGMLTNNKSLDYSGWIQHEIIRTTIISTDIAVGAPILNNCGAIIGMSVGTAAVASSASSGLTTNFVIGVSEYFMRRPLKTFLQGEGDCKYQRHLGTINDSLGNYYYYIKGYLGLSWTAVTGADFNHLASQSGINVPIYEADGTLSNIKCTENVGIRVVTVAQSSAPQTFDIANPTDPLVQADQNPLYASLPYFSSQTPAIYPGGYVPDTTTGDIPASPFEGEIYPNDIVYAISSCRSSSGTLKRKCKFGDLEHQVAPGMYTWGKLPGETVYLLSRDYRYHWAQFNLFQSTLAVFPMIMDWPWYARQIWPTVDAPLPISTTGNLPFVGFKAAF